MDLQRAQIINENILRDVQGATALNLELCRIERVNTDTMLLDVCKLGSAKLLSNIPFVTPNRFLDRGILVIPEEKSLAILATTYNQYSFVIGCLSYATSDEINEYLQSGEVLIQSKGYSFIKSDNSGNVVMSSSSGDYILNTPGNIVTGTTTYTGKTLAKDIKSGLINNIVQEIEKYYDKDIECSLSAKEIVQTVLSNGNIEVSQSNPVVVIQKGNVVNNDGQIVKLELYEDNENPEACYSLQVLGTENQCKCSIMIGKDGSIKIKGNKISFDCEELDLSGAKSIIQD